MKKIKLTFMSVAILLSIGGAFATKYHQDCRYSIQYYYNGAQYMQVPGDMGVDYICSLGPAVCTYYQVAGGYAACQTGVYTPIQAATKAVH